MTDTSKLGKELITRIIQYAIGYPTENLCSWTQKLKYLHICRFLKDIAEKLVLNEGYIELDHYSNGKMYRTNVGVIVDRQCFGMPTHFYINTMSPMAYSVIFREVVTILKLVYDPGFIHTLKIDMLLGTGNYTDLSTLIRSKKTYIDFVATICICMQNVSRLTILESNILRPEITNRFYEKYSNCLEYLYAPVSSSLKFYPYANDLTFLRLGLLPSIVATYRSIFNPSSLIYLSLSDVPAYYDWGCFTDKPGYIEFNNLEVLEISFLDVTLGISNLYIDTKSTITAKSKVYFPKLEKITISNCPSQSSILECLTYYYTINKVSISGSVDSIASSLGIGFFQQEYLNIYIHESGWSNTGTFINTTNYFFGLLVTKIHASFVVDFNVRINDIERIMWPNLTNIIINSLVDADVFLALVLKLSNLQSAMARNLKYNILPIYKEDADISVEQRSLTTKFNIQGDIYSAFSAFVTNIRCRIEKGSREYNLSLQRLEHLAANRKNIQMQTMSLYFSKQTEKRDLKKLYIVFVAAVFPSVEVLEIDSGIGYISGVIQRLSEMIPHFADVDIRNVDGDMALEEKISKLNFFS